MKRSDTRVAGLGNGIGTELKVEQESSMKLKILMVEESNTRTSAAHIAETGLKLHECCTKLRRMHSVFFCI
jgi:hypothetical protein